MEAPDSGQRGFTPPTSEDPSGSLSKGSDSTINDTHDFSIGKQLPDVPALRELGFSANRHLLSVQRTSCDLAGGAVNL